MAPVEVASQLSWMYHLPVYPHELQPQAGIFTAPQTCISSAPLAFASPVPCLNALASPYPTTCLSQGPAPGLPPQWSLPQGLGLLGSLSIFDSRGVCCVVGELIVVFAIEFQAGLCLLPFQASYARTPHSEGGAGRVTWPTM